MNKSAQIRFTRKHANSKADCVHCHKPLGPITKNSDIINAWAHTSCHNRWAKKQKPLNKRKKKPMKPFNFKRMSLTGARALIAQIDRIEKLTPSQRRKLGIRLTHLPPTKSRSKKWIQKAVKPKNKGALHRMLHIPLNRKISAVTLRIATKRPDKWYPKNTRMQTLLRKRAQFALNVRKRGTKRTRGRTPRLNKLAKRHSRSNAKLGF